MSDASANVDFERKDGHVVKILVAKYAECAAIYKGQLVGREASGGTSPGYGYHLGDDAGAYFAGVAYEPLTQVSTETTDGTNHVRVWRTGIHVMTFADGAGAGTAAETLCGQVVCAVDSSTVDLAAQTTNDVEIGRIVAIKSASALTIWVSIDGYC